MQKTPKWNKSCIATKTAIEMVQRVTGGLGGQIKGKDGKDVDVASFQGEGKVGVMASVQYHAS